MNPSCSPPPEGHIKLNSATEIMILSLLCVILKSAAADGWFVRCVAGCRLGLVGARLATCYSDARALYRFLVLLLLSPGCPRCVRALAIARALPSSPTGTDWVSPSRAIAFVPRLSSAPVRSVRWAGLEKPTGGLKPPHTDSGLLDRFDRLPVKTGQIQNRMFNRFRSVSRPI